MKTIVFFLIFIGNISIAQINDELTVVYNKLPKKLVVVLSNKGIKNVEKLVVNFGEKYRLPIKTKSEIKLIKISKDKSRVTIIANKQAHALLEVYLLYYRIEKNKLTYIKSEKWFTLRPFESKNDLYRIEIPDILLKENKSLTQKKLLSDFGKWINQVKENESSKIDIQTEEIKSVLFIKGNNELMLNFSKFLVYKIYSTDKKYNIFQSINKIQIVPNDQIKEYYRNRLNR